MLFNTRFWLVKVLLTPTIEKMIFSSAIYRLRLYFLSAAPGCPSRWFRAGRIRHHRAARRNDSDKDTTNFRIFGPCGGIIRLRAGLRIRRQSSHTGRGCRPEEGRGRAPPGTKAPSAVTSGPTGRFARASAGLPSQTADSDRRIVWRLRTEKRRHRITRCLFMQFPQRMIINIFIIYVNLSAF